MLSVYLESEEAYGDPLREARLKRLHQTIQNRRRTTEDKYPDKSFSVFEDLRGFGNLAGLMSDSYLRIYVRVLIEQAGKA